MEKNALWVRVNKAIHDRFGGLGQFGSHPVSRGPWPAIAKTFTMLHDLNLIRHDSIRRRLGNGVHTFFGKEFGLGIILFIILSLDCMSLRCLKIAW